MLSMFNDNIAKIAKFLYSEQLSRLLSNVSHIVEYDKLFECVVIFAINFIIAAGIFLFAYKKRGISS